MIWHREPMSNGVHSASRPRGLHPAVFGQDGSGWAGVASRIVGIAKKRGRFNTFFWCVGGTEPDGTISDRPFDRALADPAFPWASKLCDYPAMEDAFSKIKEEVGEIGVYVGAPTSDRTDSFLMRLASVGLIRMVGFDAMAHQPPLERQAHCARYERLGVTIGYEAVPNVEMADLWQDRDKVLISTLRGWNEAQFRVRNLPMHPKRNVPELAIVSKVLLLDIHDDVAGTHAALSEGHDVAINMLASNWSGRPTFTE